MFCLDQSYVEIVWRSVTKEVFPDLINIHGHNILILTKSIAICQLLFFGKVDQFLIRVYFTRLLLLLLLALLLLILSAFLGSIFLSLFAIANFRLVLVRNVGR